MSETVFNFAIHECDSIHDINNHIYELKKAAYTIVDITITDRSMGANYKSQIDRRYLVIFKARKQQNIMTETVFDFAIHECDSIHDINQHMLVFANASYTMADINITDRSMGANYNSQIDRRYLVIFKVRKL
jgi:hypothetical protein